MTTSCLGNGAAQCSANVEQMGKDLAELQAAGGDRSRELEKGGMSQDKAIERAKEFISSGVTPPVATPLDITDKLVKVVPAGGQPSSGTGYWMRESELASHQRIAR